MLNLVSALGLMVPLMVATPPEVQSVIAANNQFAIDLYQQFLGRVARP